MFDVIIVGSGAAGMTTALCTAHRGLRTLVIEKAEHFGGSTARSGGGIWVPNNAVVQAAGRPDSPEQASTYLAHIAGDVPAELREAFLDAGPAMLAFVLRAHAVGVPLGARLRRLLPGGARRAATRPLGGAACRSTRRLLGDELAQLEPPYVPTPAGIVITQSDYRWLTLVARHPRGLLTAAKVFARRFLPGSRLTMGQALAAGLRAGLRALDVEVRLNTAFTDLHFVDGRVAGVLVGDEVIEAPNVVLASGGFERNERMRKQHQDDRYGVDSRREGQHRRRHRGGHPGGCGRRR